VVTQTIQIEGVPLHVIDTAGLRETSDEVEQIGIERAWGQIAGADAVLFLHDLTRFRTPSYADGDAVIARELHRTLPRGVTVIDVWNKSDVESGAQSAAPAMPEEPTGATGSRTLSLSAKTGAGVDELRAMLLEVAGWEAAPEGIYIARARHVLALARVDAHLVAAKEHLLGQARFLDLLAEELRLAQGALNEITGEFSSDDLLGVIFSSFCIGK
jgi:tRNA modification GTPase